LAVDSFRDAYAKHLGHKCTIERWLVVGEQGLAATLKRIPHVVTVVQADGAPCMKATLSVASTKENLIEADLNFRKELRAKNAAAKSAKAGAPPAPVPAAAPKGKAPSPAPVTAQAAETVDILKKADGPTRPPATIEDFLWNLHSVLEAYGGPLPTDQFKDAYSKHLGHKCAVERFLVVGDVGLAGTFKRIPHVVTVSEDKSSLICVLPKGSTRDDLIKADQDYRKLMQEKAAAAKPAATKAGSAPPAASAKAAPAAVAGQARPTEGGGEPDAKRAKPGDADTLSRMLIQGVVRVLQQRVKDGKGPLQIDDLAEEFKILWKVPFNLQQAGYTDAVTFLKAWPAKVELSSDDSIVSIAKKVLDKAEAPKAQPPAQKAAETPVAKKAAPPVPQPKAEPPALPPKVAAPAAETAVAEGEPCQKGKDHRPGNTLQDVSAGCGQSIAEQGEGRERRASCG
jgi:hypothetical protein